MTRPFSTSVLTSSPARAESDANVFSMFDWMVASSICVGVVCPPAGDDSAVGCFAGVGVVLDEDLGEGEKLGPAGTTCCGATLAFIGSNGRLVM